MKTFALICFFALWAGTAFAQEICNNGLDDDNDGYVDCFDPDCSGSFFCGTSFFGGPVPGCQSTPAPSPVFSMGVLWMTDTVATPMDNRRTPVIGDIDLDGVPEVITANGGATAFNSMYVFNGATGALERTINAMPVNVFSGSYAIGDVDADGFGEILMVADGSVGRQLYCYEHNGNLKWSSSVAVGFAINDQFNTPSLADFDSDGIVEVYMGNQIYNSANGNLIATGTSTMPKGAHSNSTGEVASVAVDVLPTGFCPDCQGLELVCGNTVYSVNIGTGTITARVSIASLFDGLTSVADIDMDGDLDAVVVANNGAGRGVVYAWDLQTPAQIGNTFQIDLCSAAGAFVTTSGGLATIGDLDGNGTPDIGVAGNSVYLALRYDSGTNTLVEMWSRSADDPSERTGSTLFDFEGDGAVEVLYRDQDSLRVYDGTTGTVKFAYSCPSLTRLESPVVADVDNNGQANIVCHCGKSVTAFEPVAQTWVSARSVWNQRNYFVLNVNDNLSIPRQQQRQEIGFPAGAPVNYPFNAYLNQVPTLADNGALPFPVANDSITIINPSTDIDLGPCQNGIRDSVGVRLAVFNSGDAPIPAGTPIAFYNGNPYLAGATFMQLHFLPSPVPAGASLQLPMLYVDDQGGTFDLYYQINDDGTNAIPLTGPAFQHLECNYGNNMGFITIVNCGNTAPVIDTFGLVTDTILLTSFEDQPVQYCVSATDLEFNEHDITGIIGAIGLGTATGIGDNDSCFTLTPVLDTTGTTIFQIIVCDNGNISLCDTAWFIWTILPGNDPPVAINDTVTTPEDTPILIQVANNDTDPEGNPMSVLVIGGPFHGTATMSGNDINYNPAPNYFGQDTIYYQICDNFLPPGCDTAIVIINVTPVNDIPLAGNDSISLPNDTTTVTIAVDLNDTDVEPGPLTVTITCGPSSGTATLLGNDILFTPDSTFIGLDTICYTICDTATPIAGCDTGYVFINQFNSNIAPIAVDDIDTTTLEDTLIVTLLPNDSDPNGHTFSITELSCGPYHGTVSLDTLTGLLTYVPAVGYLGPDTICYVICDNPPAGGPFCDTAYVLIQVNSDNRNPIAVRDTNTIVFNATSTVDVLANDSDPDNDSLFVTIIQMPINGTVLLSGGIATYTPAPNFVGVDSFCYQLCDNGIPSLCDTACVFITIQGPNELIVPNGFSPNGDGANDVLEIDGMALYPNSQLLIFNRWGGTVFEALNGYNNDWDGSYNGSPLPEGTYFFRLDPGDGTPPMTGYIVLYR